MEVAKINDTNIPLDSEQVYFQIGDRFYGDPLIKISFIELDKDRKSRILFLGFPSSENIHNISHEKLFKPS